MPNIFDFDRLYRRTVKEVAGSADPHYIKLDKVDAQQLRVLSHVTVEDKTTGYTKLRIGIDNGGVIHYLDELETIAADELAVARSDVQLGEGDVFFAELTGINSGDELVLTCIGWEKAL